MNHEDCWCLSYLIFEKKRKYNILWVTGGELHWQFGTKTPSVKIEAPMNLGIHKLIQ